MLDLLTVSGLGGDCLLGLLVFRAFGGQGLKLNPGSWWQLYPCCTTSPLRVKKAPSNCK